MTRGGLRQEKVGFEPFGGPHFSQSKSQVLPTAGGALLQPPLFFDSTSDYGPSPCSLKDPWRSLPQGLCTGLSLLEYFSLLIGTVYSALIKSLQLSLL